MPDRYFCFLFLFLFILSADNAYSKIELCERVAVRFARV
jgi:hypothetical protein